MSTELCALISCFVRASCLNSLSSNSPEAHVLNEVVRPKLLPTVVYLVHPPPSTDSVMECGLCLRAGDPSPRDCQGTCSNQFAVDEESGRCEAVVQPQEQEQEQEQEEQGEVEEEKGGGCDGEINKCGVCTGGSTGLAATAGTSSDCGYCVPLGREGESTLTPGCDSCGQTVDVCGRCVGPDEDLGRE